MGNSNPAPPTHKYSELRIEENELLSSLMVVQDPISSQRMMVKQLSIGSQQEYSRVLRQARARRALSGKRMGQYLIQIKEIQTRESNEICGKNYRITLYLEYLDGTLKQVYNERQRNNNPFREDEVREIMRTVVNCLIVLHDNSYKNVHLYKQAIFRSEQGGYKLADTQLSTKIHPYFQLLNNVPTKKGTYLAPELLAEIRGNNTEFFHSPKTDIFTLAILALQLLTLSPYDHFYDYEHMTIDLPGLRNVVEQMQCSEELKSILEMMLVEEEEERIGLLSLKELLAGNEARSEDSTFKSASTSQPRKNNTTRTFISRSKPESRSSKANSMHKMNTHQHLQSTMKKEDREEERIKDLSTQRQRKLDPPTQIQNYVSNHIIYRPIEAESVPEAPQIAPIVMPPPVIYQVRQTPRSSFDIQHGFANKLNLREFQTPVNMLYQPSNHQEPQSTPIRKVQALNSLRQQSNNPQPQPQPQPQTQPLPFSTDYFTNKCYGQHVFTNGARYEGQFNANNEFDGNGMLYYPCGKLCYSGSWQSNCFHGFGVLYNENPSSSNTPTNYQNFNFVDKNDWDYYEGQFDNDRREGFGTLYFLNGDKFSGCFKGDAVQGFGTFFMASQGRNINGIWNHNELKR